jgi:hypothetical protein
MAETECPECGNEIESTADLERTEVPEIETDDNNEFSLHDNRDLFLCSGCKKPMGVGRT